MIFVTLHAFSRGWMIFDAEDVPCRISSNFHALEVQRNFHIVIDTGITTVPVGTNALRKHHEDGSMLEWKREEQSTPQQPVFLTTP